MRFLSLFSGIEAASAAWIPLGWECVGVAEIEPFPCSVLAHHYPDVQNLGDITKITQKDILTLGHIDIVIGGFPCQDLSVAGKRKGFKNEDGSNTRSGLFFDAMRIVQWTGARFVLLENVPGIYSSNKGTDFSSMVGEILGSEFSVPANGWENSGIATSERGMLEWATLDAQYFGVAQRRRRMFALADFGDWANRPPILFERHSLQGNPAPKRINKQDIAGTITTSTGRCGQAGSVAGSLIITTFDRQSRGKYGTAPVASTMCARDYKSPSDLITYDMQSNIIGRQDHNGGNGLGFAEEVAPTLTKMDRHGVVSTPFEVAGTMLSRNTSGGFSSSIDHAAGGCRVIHSTQDPCVSDIAFALGRNSEQENVFSGIQDDALYGLGVNLIRSCDASTQERNANYLLSRVQREIGEKAFSEWGFGILNTLQSTEILQQAMYGDELRPTTFTRNWVVYCALSREKDSAEGALQSLREAVSERCSPQGWESLKQLSGELGAYLSKLSQPGAQAERLMQDMWLADEGLGVLRETLSKVQKARRHVINKDKSTWGDSQVRRLVPEECEFLQGFPRGYTQVPHRGKPSANGPRYKALGNSMAVPCISWIGQRINSTVMAMEINK